MLRRFGTSAQTLALSRVRPPTRAARPTASTANSGAATTKTAASKPVSATTTQATSKTATTSAATTSKPITSRQVAPSVSASRTYTANNEFAPRLVPELAGPSSTNVSETIDPTQSVRSIPELEQTESFGEDWTTSFQGLGSRPFEPRVGDILMAPVVPEDVEVTPDGLIYLPEIKYRRILNKAFGPGGWGIAPRTKTLVTQRQVTREYGLVCLGRLVSVSRGEMDYFSAEGVTTAMEGCKSNALMRCCKDLGIASELWDPTFIRQFKQKFCESKFYEKKRRFVWKRKDRPWEYPYNQQ